MDDYETLIELQDHLIQKNITKNHINTNLCKENNNEIKLELEQWNNISTKTSGYWKTIRYEKKMKSTCELL